MKSDPCQSPDCEWHRCCPLRPPAEMADAVVEDPPLAALVAENDVHTGSATFDMLLDRQPYIGVLRICGEINETNLAGALDEFESEMPSLGGLLLVIDSHGGVSKTGHRLDAAIWTARRSMPVIAFTVRAFSAAVLPAAAAWQSFIHTDGAMGGFGMVVHCCDGREPFGLVSCQSPEKVKGRELSWAPNYLLADEEEKLKMQLMIDCGYEDDLRNLASRKGLDREPLRPLMDGRVIGAREALAAGLVDGVLAHEGVAFDILFSLAKNGRKQQTT